MFSKSLSVLAWPSFRLVLLFCELKSNPLCICTSSNINALAESLADSVCAFEDMPAANKKMLIKKYFKAKIYGKNFKAASNHRKRLKER